MAVVSGNVTDERKAGEMLHQLVPFKGIGWRFWISWIHLYHYSQVRNVKKAKTALKVQCSWGGEASLNVAITVSCVELPVNVFHLCRSCNKSVTVNCWVLQKTVVFFTVKLNVTPLQLFLRRIILKSKRFRCFWGVAERKIYLSQRLLTGLTGQ